MEAVIQSFVSGVPFLMLHFFTTLVILVAGSALYILITPMDEMALIRDGNQAAAVSLGGAIIGLAIPLAVTMAGSVNVFDIALYGSVALFLQLGCFFGVNVVLKDLPQRIEDGEMSASIFLTFTKLATACITAAAFST